MKMQPRRGKSFNEMKEAAALRELRELERQQAAKKIQGKVDKPKKRGGILGWFFALFQ